MRTFRALMPAIGLLAAAVSQTASAAEVTRVATSFEEDNKFDLHFGVAYDFDFKKASILREYGNSELKNNRLAKDLIYQQRRQTVTPSIEIGLYHDLSIYAELPIVVSDNRDYGFDQSSDPCIRPGTPDTTPDEINCVDKTNSSSIRDAIIPRDGFDSLTPSDAYNQFTGEDTQLIFTSPTRRGLDQIHVGIKKGILNQSKLSHMPNWVIAVEGRFAIGKPMQFRRDIALEDPTTNHTVGRGIHELGAWTALSRRYRFLEPFFGAWWRQSLRAGTTEFKKFPNSESPNPQSQTGVYFGAEIVPWERKAKKQKVAINFAGSAVLKYGGRAYSEVWELLADSPALVGVEQPGSQQCNVGAAVDYARANPSDPSGYLSEANAASNSGDCRRFNGITNVQDYARFGLDTALNFHLGQYARLMLGARLSTETRHFLTTANRGDPSRAGDPDRVDEGTEDVNPLRRDVIDNVGRRYAIDDVLSVVGYARFMLTF